MKTPLVVLFITLTCFACTQQVDDPTGTGKSEISQPIEDSSVSQENSEIEEQIKQNGLEILFAYYCIGSDEAIEQLNQKLGIALRGDLRTQLYSEKKESSVRILKQWISDKLDNLTEEKHIQVKEKAVQWLTISRVVNSQFCETYEESFFEFVYEIPRLKEIIDHYIDPTKGQGPVSLSSAQMSSVEIEIWNYLSDLDKRERLRIVGEILAICSNIEE